ncbi:uncharacterized protein LOC114529175 [Dendronephthya gigantea]|uniref:uncharacterized protein LOC114529175 n=1 Tax=Dendronephthya gigantea TaxID=151771 RepID=UPI00106CAECC|nr:uncharacterized protein LOC114529175 [Dendronephthya gigantea]
MAKFSMFGAVLLAVTVVHGVYAQASTISIIPSPTLQSMNKSEMSMGSSQKASLSVTPSDATTMTNYDKESITHTPGVTPTSAYVTMASSDKGNDANSTLTSGIDQQQFASASVTPTSNTTKKSSGNQNKGSLSVSFLLVLVGLAFYHIPN